MNPGDMINKSTCVSPGEERISCAAVSAEEMRVRSLAMMGWNVAFGLRGCKLDFMRVLSVCSERPRM